MKDRFGGQHHRHLVLTWPSCFWHWHWSPGARVTRLHSVVTKHRLGSLTQSHQWPHSLPGPHLSESAERRRIGISAASSAAVLQNLQLSQWRNTTITWNYWDSCLTYFITRWYNHSVSTQTPDPLICFKMPTYKSERSGGINLSKTLQQIIIEGCYREVLQKPHNPVSANPSAFKDLAMQTHAAQVWRTGTHTIYHTLIRPLLWIKHSNNSAVSAIQFVYCVRKYVASLSACEN